MPIETNIAKRACWTCRARKTPCDRKLPACRKCFQLQRQCEGYQTRLSWPLSGNKKRAITGPPPTIVSRGGGQVGDFHFVNTNFKDIELYYYFSQQNASQNRARSVWSVPDLWVQPQSKVEHKDLIDFFRDVAHRSLITFTVDTSHIRDSLLRMALARDTNSGLAIFYAILAISALCRTGLHQEAVRFKLACLHVLSASVEGGSLDPADAAQHVSACMLLAAFEILIPSESSGEWIWYIRVATNLIQQSQLEEHSTHSDIKNILDWVHYQSALSKFTMSHREDVVVRPNNPKSDTPNFESILQLPAILDYPKSRNTILSLLSETFDTIVDPKSEMSQSESYKDRLQVLQRNIRSFPSIPLYTTSSPCPATTELYRIVALIYLSRASHGFHESSAETEYLVEMAYAMPNKWPCCFHFFPLLILACEARTEERRAWVLCLLKKSGNGPRGRDLGALRRAIESFWVQQDLYADSDLLVNYYGLLSSVVSSNNSLTSFV